MPVREHPGAEVFKAHRHPCVLKMYEDRDAEAHRKVTELLAWLDTNPHPDLQSTWTVPMRGLAPAHDPSTDTLYACQEAYGVHILMITFPFWMANPTKPDDQPASTPES